MPTKKKSSAKKASGKKKFSITCDITGRATATVRADSPQEARAIFKETGGDDERVLEWEWDRVNGIDITELE